MIERHAPELPTVVATSVIRSAHQGQSHGGVFPVDLATGQYTQVIDWNDGAIDWAGRGGDRGLRGIAFHGERIFLAASDEIFVFDSLFRGLGSIKSRYLKHCHEIFIHGEALYLTSTGYDAVLEFDLERWTFRRGIGLRPLSLDGHRFASYRIAKGLAWRLKRFRLYRLFTRTLRARPFDPTGTHGPAPLDSLHINNVYADADAVYVSGTGLDGLFALQNERLRRIATVPFGTHNTRRLDGAVVYQDTVTDRVVVRDGRRIEHFALPGYDEDQLLACPPEGDHARQRFGRGLCLSGDLIIAGSSPATISVFRRGQPEPLQVVNLTRDVRNAIHGLEIWPFDQRLRSWLARRDASCESAAGGRMEPLPSGEEHTFASAGR